ncbi:hypothetical protein [Nocardioides pelophilus]|uniref:hypothetical protein n=1 Tax=Nocardioides pelophilus TaxID=2172019 RepID=UPI0015FF16CA|nr:hypothetical protein [Nocardioides pelophilus]
MDEQELKARMRAADRARDAAPADSWIDDLAEATMTKTNDEQPRGRRTWVLAAAAAAVVATVGGGAFALTQDDDGGNGQDEAVAAERPEELALSLPEPNAMQMCVEFSPEVLAPLKVAFSAEVEDVEGDTVRLVPDHWYRGDTGADVVVLTAGRPEVLLEGGITFEEGKRYLVSADGDQVATCGLSGPYTDEMAAAYDEAFGD